MIAALAVWLTLPGDSAAQRQVDALLAGVRQAGDSLGSPAAPVTLQFFGDLEDSTSRAFAVADMPYLISRWVRSSQLRVEYRAQETVTSQPSVFMSQQASALAAGAQDKGWYYIELFYREPSEGEGEAGYVASAHLDQIAEQVPGLNLARWQKDRSQPSLRAQVASQEDDAARLGVKNTPGLLVGLTGSGHASQLPPFTVCEPAVLYSAIEKTLVAARTGHAASAPSTSRAASKKLAKSELGSC